MGVFRVVVEEEVEDDSKGNGVAAAPEGMLMPVLVLVLVVELVVEALVVAVAGGGACSKLHLLAASIDCHRRCRCSCHVCMFHGSLR